MKRIDRLGNVTPDKIAQLDRDIRWLIEHPGGSNAAYHDACGCWLLIDRALDRLTETEVALKEVVAAMIVGRDDHERRDLFDDPIAACEAALKGIP